MLHKGGQWHPIEKIQLQSDIEGWLEEIRATGTINHTLANGELLAVQWLEASQSSATTLNSQLQTCCQQLPDLAAKLLNAYYWKQQTIQAIKNNQRRRESVATLWRRLREAIEQLCAIFYESEIVARNSWQQHLHKQVPPSSTDLLFGRSATTFADQLQTPDQFLFNLIGIGGLGKSALTNAIVHQLIDNWQLRDLLWIDVEQSNCRTQSLLHTITERLHTHLIGERAADPTHQQRMAYLQERLADHSMLIVVDNIETIADDDGLLSAELFSLTNPSRFLLVSRTRLVADMPVRTLPLSELSAEAAIELVQHRAVKLGITPPPALLHERLRATLGGHPQALRLFVQLCRYFSADEILDEFAATEIKDINHLYAAIYELIYQRQSADARQILAAMCLVPSSGAEHDYLAAICQLEKGQLWQSIQALGDAALLERLPASDPPHYRIHSLTHTFLLRQTIDAACQTAQQLAALAYWQVQVDDSADTTFLHINHSSLVKLVTITLADPTCWQAAGELMLTLYHPIYNSLHWREWMPLFQRALDHAQDDQRLLQYRLYSRLATLHHRTDNYEQAAVMHLHALRLAQLLNNVKGIGRENAHLCLAYSYLNQPIRARQHGETALDIFEELNLHPHFHLVALNSLGQNEHVTTNFSAAARYFEQAILLGRDRVPAPVLATVYTNWGDTLRLAGNDERADAKYAAATRLLAEMPHNLQHILLIHSKCNLLLAAGKVVEAEQAIQSTIYDYHSTTLPALHCAHIAETKGWLALTMQSYPTAIEHLEKAVWFWQQTSMVRGWLTSSALLTKAQFESGAVATARQSWKQLMDTVTGDVFLQRWWRVYRDHYGLTELQDKLSSTK